jgi:hypothetical protein
MLQGRISERTPTAPRPANNRAKLTNNPRRIPVSGRTALGRRIHDLADGYAAALGGWPGLSDLMVANVRRAAELTALSEQTRADALRNGNVDPLAVVRMEGAAAHATRLLQLDQPREPELTIEQLAAYTAPAARQVREAAGRGSAAASRQNAPLGRTSRRRGHPKGAA